MVISKKVQDMAPSGIRAFFDLVLGMKDVISLGVGEPDFVTPWSIREAAIYSIEKGYTSYTSNKGLLGLRHDLSRYIKRRFDVEYDPEEEILITVGVSEALDLTMRALLNPGDKVIIPEPSYVSYGPVTSLADGVPVFVKTRHQDGFKITPKDIEKACDKKTRLLLLNYPSNPTGASYTKRELAAIDEVAKKHKLIVISDEIYGDLTYDFEHTCFASIKGAKRHTIYLNGFSKAYAMTGWRVGYACGPKEYIAAMTKIHQYTMLCASISGQMAAKEALVSGDKDVQGMLREYGRRREYVMKRLDEIGLPAFKPQGAFYVFPSIKKTGLSSIEFANQLLKKEKVAVVPGTAFGPSGEGHIRIAYASSIETLKEAFNRIGRFVNNRR